MRGLYDTVAVAEARRGRPAAPLPAALRVRRLPSPPVPHLRNVRARRVQ